jgi:serine/threonine-protein kinase
MAAAPALRPSASEPDHEVSHVTLASPTILRVEQQIDRYRILGLLGRGGMAEVYVALDLRLQRQVALKVLAPSLASRQDENWNGRCRFLREARAVARLRHPNIVAVFDVGEESGIVFLAMELVEGVSLRALIGSPDITHEQKLDWLTRCADALDAAHRAGIVHRDFKPDNVMLDSNGTVKLVDFGVAKVAAGHGDLWVSHTVPGLCFGTLDYMSPEQRLGGPVDGRSDQYAWGLTVWELFAGWHPYSAGSDVAGGLPPLVGLGLPAALDEVVRRTLSSDPGQRFRDLREAAAALRRAFATQSEVGAVVSDAPPSRAPSAIAAKGRARPIAMAFALVVLAALGFASWLWVAQLVVSAERGAGSASIEKIDDSWHVAKQ